MRASIRLSQASTLSSVPKDFHFERDARRVIPTPVSTGSQSTGSKVFDPALSVTVRVGVQGWAIRCHPARADAGHAVESIKTASVAKIAAFIRLPPARPRGRGVE